MNPSDFKKLLELAKDCQPIDPEQLAKAQQIMKDCEAKMKLALDIAGIKYETLDDELIIQTKSSEEERYIQTKIKEIYNK